MACVTVLVLIVGVGWWVSAAPEVGLPQGRSGSPVVGEEGDWASEPAAVPQQADDRLPSFSGTLHREARMITRGESLRFEVASKPGARYLLQFVCAGSGRVEAGLVGGEPVGGAVCGESFESVELAADGARLVIRIASVGPEPVAVAVQLLLLP